MKILKFVWAFLLAVFAAIACVFLRQKSSDKKIEQIEREAKNEIAHLSDTGVANYLNDVLSSRRNSKR
jgi:septation ring formation regulator EzrA